MITTCVSSPPALVRYTVRVRARGTGTCAATAISNRIVSATYWGASRLGRVGCGRSSPATERNAYRPLLTDGAGIRVATEVLSPASPQAMAPSSTMGQRTGPPLMLPPGETPLAATLAGKPRVTKPPERIRRTHRGAATGAPSSRATLLRGVRQVADRACQPMRLGLIRRRGGIGMQLGRKLCQSIVARLPAQALGPLQLVPH